MFYSLAKRMCLVLSKTRLERLENSKWGSRQNDIKSFKDRQSWLLQEVGKPAQAHEFDEFSNFISQGSFNITVSGQRAFYRGSKLMNTRATADIEPMTVASRGKRYIDLRRGRRVSIRILGDEAGCFVRDYTELGRVILSLKDWRIKCTKLLWE